MAHQDVSRFRRRTGAWPVVVLALFLALTGCGSGDTLSSADDSFVEQPAEAPGAVEGDSGGVADAPAQEEAAGSGGAQDGDEDQASVGAGVTLGASGQDRQVVTSSIDVAVEDVPAAARRVRDLALVAGGFVSGESSVGGEQPRAEITLRVPVDSTTDVMADVAGLGEEVSRTTDSEDVETRLVDLESRSATQRAGVERVRALLERAESLEDVLALETELTRRQADLESVVSQQAALADRAALATVTVLLTRPADVETAVAPLPPFLSGLGAGWEALVASTTVVLVVVGALLPFTVVALVLGAAGWSVLRAGRSSRALRRAGRVEQAQT